MERRNDANTHNITFMLTYIDMTYLYDNIQHNYLIKLFLLQYVNIIMFYVNIIKSYIDIIKTYCM